jgi:hypothetical protein
MTDRAQHRTAASAQIIASRRDREQRLLRCAMAFLVTGLLIGQLLLLISP